MAKPCFAAWSKLQKLPSSNKREIDRFSKITHPESREYDTKFQS